MENKEITVVYKWTAKEGKSEELKAIDRDVEKQMKEREPNALKVDCYFEESSNTLIVYDLFQMRLFYEFLHKDQFLLHHLQKME